MSEKLNICSCCGQPFIMEPLPVTKFQSTTSSTPNRRKDKTCIDCRPEPNRTLDLWQYFQKRLTSFYPAGYATE